MRLASARERCGRTRDPQLWDQARPELACDSVRENLLELPTGAECQEAGRKRERGEQDNDQEVMQEAPAA